MGQGKHFQLVVPGYDPTGTESPLSYLRLGNYFAADEATVLSSPTRRGDDLVWNHGDDGAATSKLAFKDDWRSPTLPSKPYVFDDGVTRGHRGRKVQTGSLLTRGGYRDHTDGNRISTTRGDCVEVVQGNYKLIVLGRVANTWDPSGLGEATSDGVGLGRTRQEISGGHYNESTSTPGEVLSITWSENEDGTWTTLEQTDHGDVKSTFRGWMREEYHGPQITSTIGVAAPPLAIEQDRPDPSTTAHHPAQTPDIDEQTYARSIDVAEHYLNLYETTRLRGGGTIHDTTHVEHSFSDKTHATVFSDTTACVGLSQHLVCADKVERDGFSILRNNIKIGLVDCGISAIAIDVTKRKGFAITAKLAASVSVNGTVLAIALNMPNVDTKLRIGPVNIATLGPSVEVGGMKTEITLKEIITKAVENEPVATKGTVGAQGTENHGVDAG